MLTLNQDGSSASRNQNKSLVVTREDASEVKKQTPAEEFKQKVETPKATATEAKPEEETKAETEVD